MTPLKFIITTLIGLVITGCTLTPVPPTNSTASGSPPRPNSPATPTTDGGRLAYIGGDGNIYLTEAAGRDPMPLTGDATTAYEGQGLSYQRLAWSPQGRLAYASVERTGGMARSQLYVMDEPGQTARLVGQSEDHFVIYLYWSPVPCPGQPDCRHLAYLIEETDDIALRLVRLEADRHHNRRIGAGWPFYFSWAADGRSLLWHSGYNRPEARLAQYHLDRKATETLAPQPGNFLAPAWSPQAETWLGVTTNDETSRLQNFGDATPQLITSAGAGEVAFVWSPDGRQVAYAARRYATDPFYGPIHRFDVESGHSTRLTDLGLRILAFFWSPDDQRLGYLTRQVLPDTEWMQWRVYDVTSGEDRGFATFQPTPQMRFIMASFNQYAQSHRFWSPDSRYLVYAAQEGQTRQIWLVDTWAERGSEPLYVAEGSMGFWSWQ